AVDEVTHGGLRVHLSVLSPRGQHARRNATGLFEIRALFRFGFEVVVVEVREDEIEHVDPPLYVLDFMFPAVAEVFAPEMPIELAREDVVDEPVTWEAFGSCVLARLQLRPELRRALTPMRSREREELARKKI